MRLVVESGIAREGGEGKAGFPRRGEGGEGKDRFCTRRTPRGAEGKEGGAIGTAKRLHPQPGVGRPGLPRVQAPKTTQRQRRCGNGTQRRWRWEFTSQPTRGSACRATPGWGRNPRRGFHAVCALVRRGVIPVGEFPRFSQPFG